MGLKTIHKIIKAGHRDLNPANILVMNRDKRKPRLKICDYGLAEINNIDFQILQGKGYKCNFYETIETDKSKLEGINSKVCKSDIWSLAIIFHEIIFLSHLNEENDESIENKKIRYKRVEEFNEKI
jgi:serine/threonine protein kinase